MVKPHPFVSNVPAFTVGGRNCTCSISTHIPGKTQRHDQVVGILYIIITFKCNPVFKEPNIQTNIIRSCFFPLEIGVRINCRQKSGTPGVAPVLSGE